MEATMADPLSVTCPECNAPGGEKCVNYKHKTCAPHRRRKAAACDAKAAGPVENDGPPAAWKEAKSLHPGMIVFWREGDDYALYGEDAVLAVPLFMPKAKTGPNDVVRVPMNDLEKALGLLLKAGHRVAVCENMADSKENRPLPRRRPVGPPAPRWIKLAPGETELDRFDQWDREGRIPEGSTLCEVREGGRMERLKGAALKGTDLDRDWVIVSTIRTAPHIPGGGLLGSPSRQCVIMARR